MPYALFYSLCPTVAENETRVVIVPPGIESDIPAGEYAFCEMFCDEPGCDCRRVFFAVILNNNAVAVITYGWESPAFYAKWMRSDDPADIADLVGVGLNMASPQSQLAPLLLNYFETVLLQDKPYIERVKRHYKMFRRLVK